MQHNEGERNDLMERKCVLRFCVELMFGHCKMFDGLKVAEMGLCRVNHNSFVRINVREFYLQCSSHEAGNCLT